MGMMMTMSVLAVLVHRVAIPEFAISLSCVGALPIGEERRRTKSTHNTQQQAQQHAQQQPQQQQDTRRSTGEKTSKAGRFSFTHHEINRKLTPSLRIRIESIQPNAALFPRRPIEVTIVSDNGQTTSMYRGSAEAVRVCLVLEQSGLLRHISSNVPRANQSPATTHVRPHRQLLAGVAPATLRVRHFCVGEHLNG